MKKKISIKLNMELPDECKDINLDDTNLLSVDVSDFDGWIKFSEEFPPKNEPILIAMKNKNMIDGGIWLYDTCEYTGGDYTKNENFDRKINWEKPLYWKKIISPDFNNLSE